MQMNRNIQMGYVVQGSIAAIASKHAAKYDCALAKHAPTVQNICRRGVVKFSKKNNSAKMMRCRCCCSDSRGMRNVILLISEKSSRSNKTTAPLHDRRERPLETRARKRFGESKCARGPLVHGPYTRVVRVYIYIYARALIARQVMESTRDSIIFLRARSEKVRGGREEGCREGEPEMTKQWPLGLFCLNLNVRLM